MLCRVASGALRIYGDDLATMRGADQRAMRKRVGVVFQDPATALNPRMHVADQLADPLRVHGIGDEASRAKRVKELISLVGLPSSALDALPGQLSGGQRQRVAIARALSIGPDAIIADEPTSMLDVSTRREVLQLLRGLTQERGIGILFITHDLASARHLADRVMVLYAGSVVESGRTADVLAAPRHPYTRLLRSAVPDGADFLRAPLPVKAAAGPVPLTGCAFAPRCPHADERCHATRPPEHHPAADHLVRCHLESSKGVLDNAAVPS